MVIYILMATPTQSRLPYPLKHVVPQIADARPTSDLITLYRPLNGPLPATITLVGRTTMVLLLVALIMAASNKLTPTLSLGAIPWNIPVAGIWHQSQPCHRVNVLGLWSRGVFIHYLLIRVHRCVGAATSS